jgi:acetyltransferase-like isoleucine patch superfamily enzyme
MNRDRKFSSIINCDIGEGTIVYDQVNLYKCKIGINCKIDSFVYIEEGVIIGNSCKVRAFTFIPSGVTIGSDVFIGPRVTFTNDRYPKIKGVFNLELTIVEDNVSIGAGSVILPGITIGEGSLIAAGSVVTKSIPKNVKFIGGKILPL